MSTLEDVIHRLSVSTGVKKPIRSITLDPKVFNRYVKELIDAGEFVLTELEPDPFNGPILWDGVMIHKGDSDE